MEKKLVINGGNLAGGYFSQIEGRSPNELSQPSANVRLTLEGQAVTRAGYVDTGWDLGLTHKLINPVRMDSYGLTFFAGGTKVLYRKDSDGNIYDTGLTLTDGTINWMEDYAGDMGIMNPTDGAMRVAVCTLRSAVASGDTVIALEPSAAIRFAQTGNVRIKGVNIAYTDKGTATTTSLAYAYSTSVPSAVGTVTFTFTSAYNFPKNGKIVIKFPPSYVFDSGGTTAASSTTFDGTFAKSVTGQTITITRQNDGTNTTLGTFDLTLSHIENPAVLPTYPAYDLKTQDSSSALIDHFTYIPNDVLVLTTTAGAAYNAGEIAIYTEALPLIPKGSKFTYWKECMNVMGVTGAVTGYDAPKYTLFFSKFAAATAGNLANIYDFASTPAGGEPCGRKGSITNIYSLYNRLFLFKEDETYLINTSDVNTTTGARPPQLFSNKYGCVNQFCAQEMDGDVIWMTQNRRIMKSTIQVPQGSVYPSIFPDESFDRPVYELLLAADADQTQARMHYWTKGRLLFVILSFSNQKFTLIYDNNVKCWLPPDTNKNFGNFFEIAGDLYAIADNDDTIYQLEYGTADAGAPIDCVVATGNLQIEGAAEGKGFATCDWEETEWRGKIATGTSLSYTPYVDGNAGNSKTILASDVIPSSSGSAIGQVLIGNATVGGATPESGMQYYSYRVANYPSIGNKFQLRWETDDDGHAFAIDAYKIYVTEFSDSFLTTN